MGFHSINAGDETPEAWEPLLDWVLATDGERVVSQASANLLAEPHAPDDLEALGVDWTVPSGKWVPRVSTRWDFADDLSDAEIGAALAERINVLTDAGYLVTVDEVTAGGAAPSHRACAYALTKLNAPESVHWYLVHGPGVSYEVFDADASIPFITLALESGSGLLCEFYLEQGRAERTGDVREWIAGQYRGSGDSRLPYLLRRKRLLNSSSRVGLVFSPVARFARPRTRVAPPIRLPWGRFLDLAFQQARKHYPDLFLPGSPADLGLGHTVSSWIWDSFRLVPPARTELRFHDTFPGSGPSLDTTPHRSAADVFLDLLLHYPSPGPVSPADDPSEGGKNRFYRPL